MTTLAQPGQIPVASLISAACISGFEMRPRQCSSPRRRYCLLEDCELLCSPPQKLFLILPKCLKPLSHRCFCQLPLLLLCRMYLFAPKREHSSDWLSGAAQEVRTDCTRDRVFGCQSHAPHGRTQQAAHLLVWPCAVLKCVQYNCNMRSMAGSTTAAADLTHVWVLLRGLASAHIEVIRFATTQIHLRDPIGVKLFAEHILLHACGPLLECIFELALFTCDLGLRRGTAATGSWGTTTENPWKSAERAVTERSSNCCETGHWQLQEEVRERAARQAGF